MDVLPPLCNALQGVAPPKCRCTGMMQYYLFHQVCKLISLTLGLARLRPHNCAPDSECIGLYMYQTGRW